MLLNSVASQSSFLCHAVAVAVAQPNSETAHVHYLHQAERRCRALHHDQHIQGVIVFTQSLGNEAIVVGVANAAGQHTVNIQHAGVLVQLILDLGALHTNQQDMLNCCRVKL